MIECFLSINMSEMLIKLLCLSPLHPSTAQAQLV
jgi:hypothetical protein